MVSAPFGAVCCGRQAPAGDNIKPPRLQLGRHCPMLALHQHRCSPYLPVSPRPASLIHATTNVWVMLDAAPKPGTFIALRGEESTYTSINCIDCYRACQAIWACMHDASLLQCFTVMLRSMFIQSDRDAWGFAAAPALYLRIVHPVQIKSGLLELRQNTQPHP